MARGRTPKAAPGRAGLKVGDVLNHIFEVRRFIDRGGMGEVFEGRNVNTDETVAIKVMLPEKAADEKFVAMFRKEARTLTKLSHEALVSYRVLAQEPKNGLFYIVTEFIEGVELRDMLGNLDRTPEALAGLLERLALGLGHAHRLGAIHRDMSPDNVMLPGGDLKEAKIIDFGIAKDLDPAATTIVGPGVAGKLNYIAPEQLGEHGGEVGPWSDVYSLALVILAVAEGRDVDMSGSFADAIDKRRRGPNLSVVPAGLRALLEDMLRPDPGQRIRSMDEVLRRLERLGETEGAVETVAAWKAGDSARDAVDLAGRSDAVVEHAGPGDDAERGRGSWWRTALGAAAAGAVVAAVLVWAGPGTGRDDKAAAADPSPPAPDSVAAILDRDLAAIPCSLLDVASVDEGANRLSVALRGVAEEAGVARDRILGDRALPLGTRTVETGGVAPMSRRGCQTLDTFRPFRSPVQRLRTSHNAFEMDNASLETAFADGPVSTATFDLDLSQERGDFTLLAMHDSGALYPLVRSRREFEAMLARSVNGDPVRDLGGGRFRFNLLLQQQGWRGVLLITGRGPFAPELVAPSVRERTGAWSERFRAAATAGNWRIESAWFQAVNRQPDTAVEEEAPPQPSLDGRWEVTWTDEEGTPYLGRLEANGAEAILLVAYIYQGEEMLVRQACSVDTTDTVEIVCRDHAFAVGSGNYTEDKLRLSFVDENTLRGVNILPDGTTIDNVVLNRR